MKNHASRLWKEPNIFIRAYLCEKIRFDFVLFQHIVCNHKV